MAERYPPECSYIAIYTIYCAILVQHDKWDEHMINHVLNDG